MTQSAWLQQSDWCDSETALTVLNAFSAGLFLIEPASGTCRVLNSAAAAMIGEIGDDPAGPLPIDKFFPESEQLTGSDFDEASHLAHFPSNKPGGLCDVHVQFRRLPSGDRSVLADEPLLAIVRRIGAKASASGLSPRDAFDD